VLSSAVAPVLLIGGWIVAARLQPVPFNSVGRSISTLAAVGMPHRWLITLAILGVGLCDVLTGLALRSAAEAGRVALIMGGVCGMLVAANPQPRHGGSPVHELFSFFGVVLLTVWPVAAIRLEPAAPRALRPAAAWAALLVTLGLVLWFTVQLFHGTELGLAERFVTADQALWPLVVVISVLSTRHRWPEPAVEAVSVSSQ
jgi:hypothetical membrane protein